VFLCGISKRRQLRLLICIATVLAETLLIGRLCASNAHPLNHFPSALLFSGWIIGFIAIMLVFAWENKWASMTAAIASLICYTLFYLSMFLPGRHTTTMAHGDSTLGIQIGLTMLAIVCTFSLSIGCIGYLGIDYRLRKHTSLPQGPSLIRVDQINRLFLTAATMSLVALLILGIIRYIDSSGYPTRNVTALPIHLLSTAICVGFIYQLVSRYIGSIKLRNWVIINLWLTLGLVIVVIYYVSRWGNSFNV